jgi:Hint domain
MPNFSVWMLEKQNVSVSGKGSLDGITQGDGSNLVGRSITLNNSNWKSTSIADNDGSFEDNDGSQALNGAQTINGVSYKSGTKVEAEYRIVLQDPDTGARYTAYSYNVVNSSQTFATSEGLVFRPNADGSYPPVGKALNVVQAGEGPTGATSNLYGLYDEPPCFTPGTLIDTATGPRRVEDLRVGDQVCTRDNGPQTLRWVGQARLSQADLLARPKHAPVLVRAGALGNGLPRRDLLLSPQHRVLFSGWQAELHFAEAEVLVPALALLGDKAFRPAVTGGVHYLHLLFDRHEIIFAEGAWVESLLPEWLTTSNLSPALREELALLAPDTICDDDRRAARTCLSVKEGRLFA